MKLKAVTRRSCGLIGLLMFSSAFAATARVGIASWNMGWLLDPITHQKWVQACSATGWRSADDLKAAGKPVPEGLDGMPYCDVHNGLDYRKTTACMQSLGDRFFARPNQDESSCRVSPDLADWSLYERKLQALRETFLTLEKKGVSIVAVQEVSNNAALEQIIPKGWKVQTTKDMPGAPNIPQHVGVAWDATKTKLSGFEAVGALSLKESRPLRPGLRFLAPIEGVETEFLVVHLKAGCRSIALDEAQGGPAGECKILAKQVPLIESWIDTRVGKTFVILGDFNRSLLAEVKSNPTPDSQRFGSRPNPVVSLLVPEWNDNDPKGSTIHVVDHLRKTGSDQLVAGDWFCAQTPGIDHVILSEALAQRVAMAGIVPLMSPIGYTLNGKRLPSKDKTVVPPSDHCPRYTIL